MVAILIKYDHINKIALTQTENTGLLQKLKYTNTGTKLKIYPNEIELKVGQRKKENSAQTNRERDPIQWG